MNPLQHLIKLITCNINNRFHIYCMSWKTASMASGGSRWSCAPLPGRPERAGPALARFHRERRRGLRRGGVGGRSGVHPGDRPSSKISQRWSFCRIITRLTPPNRHIPSVQVRPGIFRITSVPSCRRKDNYEGGSGNASDSCTVRNFLHTVRELHSQSTILIVLSKLWTIMLTYLLTHCQIPNISVQYNFRRTI